MTHSFGIAGLSPAALIRRAALNDLRFCMMEARTISYPPDLRMMWHDLALIAATKALDHGAPVNALRAACAGRMA